MGATEDYPSYANELQRIREVYVKAMALRLVPPGLIDSLEINEHRVNKHWGTTLPHFFRGVLDSTLIRSYIAGMKTNQLDDVAPSVSCRHFLQGELATRCARNRQYSLRAFAKFLGMDHSTLSQLLRGKRRLTERIIRQCAVPLGLDEASVINFVRGESRDLHLEDAALGEVRRLANDTASLVTDWEHYAILELVRLREFCPDSRWIARVLGLSVDEVNVALQRLLRLGLLTMDAPDHWTDQSGDTTASVRGFTREALKRLVDRSRERLLETVASPANVQCVFSETTFAVPSVCLAEIAQCIEKVRREIQSIAERAGPPDEVYRLEISFGPLTQVNQIT